MRKLMRKIIASTVMILVVGGLAFASKGGGGEKKATAAPVKNDFVPIRTTNNFTLKAGPTYSGSFLLGAEKTKNYISFNTVVTYQKGNSIFILPYHYKVNTSVFLNGNAGKSNLQMLDLRIKMHR